MNDEVRIRGLRVKEGERSLKERLLKARLENYDQRNQRLELQLETLKGQLVPIEQFKREVITANNRVRVKLMAVPKRVAPLLLGLTELAEIEEVVLTLIQESLRELAYEDTNQGTTIETEAVERAHESEHHQAHVRQSAKSRSKKPKNH